MCVTDVIPLVSVRGRVIPADLEAKIIDAKQKVGVLSILPLTLSLHISLASRRLITTRDPSHSQGCVPLFVNATAGSTVYGAFDPINEIADICEKYNLWLHVDVSALVFPPLTSALRLCVSLM